MQVLNSTQWRTIRVSDRVPVYVAFSHIIQIIKVTRDPYNLNTRVLKKIKFVSYYTISKEAPSGFLI